MQPDKGEQSPGSATMCRKRTRIDSCSHCFLCPWNCMSAEQMLPWEETCEWNAQPEQDGFLPVCIWATVSRAQVSKLTSTDSTSESLKYDTTCSLNLRAWSLIHNEPLSTDFATLHDVGWRPNSCYRLRSAPGSLLEDSSSLLPVIEICLVNC